MNFNQELIQRADYIIEQAQKALSHDQINMAQKKLTLPKQKLLKRVHYHSFWIYLATNILTIK
jgi:hypothetical protein